MNVLIITTLISFFILYISRNINFFVFRYFHVYIEENPIIGFMVLLGILFLFDYFLLISNIESRIIFSSFYFIFFVFIFLGFNKFKLNKWVIFSYFIAFLILIISLRYGLGEKLGDNSYLTSMVTMNVNELHMNTTEFSNGFKYFKNVIGPYKAYLTWYHLYSSIIFAQQKIFSFFSFEFIPPYLLFIWVGNISFYIFSIKVFSNIIERLRVKEGWILVASLLFYFYWNTIYYHLVLGHYGTNFIGLFVSGLWLLFYNSKYLDFKNIWVYMLSIYSILAMGNVGLPISAFLVFSFSVYQIFMKNDEIFLFIPFLLVPIFHWIYILNDVIPTSWLIPFVLSISVFSWLVHFIIPLKKIIFKYFVYILGLLLIIWFVLSYYLVEDYWLLFNDFFALKSNFDRLQDYFTFSNWIDSARNIAFYFVLIGLFLNDKTRKIGWMVMIIFIFFINPFIYPLLYPNLQWLYHRSYISIFNLTVLLMGIYGLFSYLLHLKTHWRYFFMIGWILLLVPSTYLQLTGFFHPIYETGSDFNIIYKLNNSEVEILEKLRQIIEFEDYENAKVISQIYSTTMYVPDVYHMFFTVYDRRGYDINIPDQTFNDLYRIFYSPVFDGDDGLRFNAPVEKTCELLIANQIDFVIYNKELSVFDKNVNNWIPTYWYARDCAEKVLENDQYIMYRFYWK